MIIRVNMTSIPAKTCWEYISWEMPNCNNRNWRYIDFKYFNVLYQPMTVSPGHIDWLPGEKYTFTAKANNSPSQCYDWDVQCKKLQSSASNSFTTEFTAPRAPIP